MKQTKLLSCAVITAISASAFADTLLVPDDYGSIQSAIDAAVEGDVVSVAEGIYYETIDFLGKAITVQSTNGSPQGTYIDGNVSSGVVVTFATGETNLSILDGLTIRNGLNQDGGGVYVFESSPTIRNCVITGNTAKRYGGGLFIDAGSVTMESTVVRGNESSSAGGGVYMRTSSATVIDSSFENNQGSSGGGLYIKDGTAEISLTAVSITGNAGANGGALYNKNSSITVLDSTFSSNEATKGGAWFSYLNGDATITNTVFLENTATDSGGAANIRSNSTVDFINCTFDTNIADSDCDGIGGSGAIDIASSTVTLEDPIICVNLVCDVIEDFSASEPVIVGDIIGCSTGLGACCGGEACWEMDYSACLDGGGVFHGEDTICEMVDCFGINSGACCLGSLCIVTANEAACVDADGIFQGIQVDCADEAVECIGCPADLNGDGSVEVNDVIEVISSWGACP